MSKYQCLFFKEQEMDNNNITLSVVMPAYNEEQHIKDNLLETSRILSRFLHRYETVSYTHLDVYKRQRMTCAPAFATPAATVPTPASDTSFTDILASRFAFLQS